MFPPLENVIGLGVFGFFTLNVVGLAMSHPLNGDADSKFQKHRSRLWFPCKGFYPSGRELHRVSNGGG